MNDLIRIKRGPLAGMTGRVVSISADDLRVRLTCQARHIRIPRSDDWYEEVDPTPLSAAEARKQGSPTASPRPTRARATPEGRRDRANVRGKS